VVGVHHGSRVVMAFSSMIAFVSLAMVMGMVLLGVAHPLLLGLGFLGFKPHRSPFELKPIQVSHCVVGILGCLELTEAYSPWSAGLWIFQQVKSSHFQTIGLEECGKVIFSHFKV
jgi:hypothetical protein